MYELAKRCLEICNRMRRWFQECNYAGIDPYLLDAKAFGLRRLPGIGRLLVTMRQLLKPLHPYFPRQVFSSCSPVVMAKAIGLILSGTARLYRVNRDESCLSECALLLELLKVQRSPGFSHLCWGQPFAWGGSIRYPPYTPAVCVTSPIAHGILDYYEIAPNDETLTMLNDVALYLMNENGYEDLGDSLCLYYAPGNPTLAYNGNIMAASFLLRLSRITADEGLVTFASRAVNFVVEGQNPDGSWFYSDPRGKGGLITTIDNRHSGFVLEHLKIAADILGDAAIEKAIERGWTYYKQVLFDGPIPKWSPTQTYPVDIHDVAQAIITLLQLGQLDWATQVTRFALDNLFDGNNQFFYKLFANGQVNKTVFIRWGQAWMFKALGLFSEAHLLARQRSFVSTDQ